MNQYVGNTSIKLNRKYHSQSAVMEKLPCGLYRVEFDNWNSLTESATFITNSPADAIRHAYTHAIVVIVMHGQMIGHQIR